MAKGKNHGRLHVVENGRTTVRKTFAELAEEHDQALEIIARQRRIIEALKLELKERDGHEQGS
jgi:hypothetical protein